MWWINCPFDRFDWYCLFDGFGNIAPHINDMHRRIDTLYANKSITRTRTGMKKTEINCIADTSESLLPKNEDNKHKKKKTWWRLISCEQRQSINFLIRSVFSALKWIVGLNTCSIQSHRRCHASCHASCKIYTSRPALLPLNREWIIAFDSNGHIHRIGDDDWCCQPRRRCRNAPHFGLIYSSISLSVDLDSTLTLLRINQNRVTSDVIIISAPKVVACDGNVRREGDGETGETTKMSHHTAQNNSIILAFLNTMLLLSLRPLFTPAVSQKSLSFYARRELCWESAAAQKWEKTIKKKKSQCNKRAHTDTHTTNWDKRSYGLAEKEFNEIVWPTASTFFALSRSSLSCRSAALPQSVLTRKQNDTPLAIAHTHTANTGAHVAA